MLRMLRPVLVTWLALFASSVAAQELDPVVAAAAHHLEERLIAPCCWRETLDVHQSPIADQLRREIRQRLLAGASSATVEAELVARYGPKLRATLPVSLGYLLFGCFGIGGLAILIALGVRTRSQTTASVQRTNSAAAPTPVPLTDREWQKYEDKLDDDLEAGAL